MGRLERLIRFSLRHSWLVLAGAGLLTVLGSVWIASLPVDIFPDLSAPTVTVITEAPGMAPEEIELLVTFPIESAVNGSAGRSPTEVGVGRRDFGDLGRIPLGNRHLPGATSRGRAPRSVVDLPAQAGRPELGPISSIMGEITFIAMTSAKAPGKGVSPMELRRLAETVVRRNLLSISGDLPSRAARRRSAPAASHGTPDGPGATRRAPVGDLGGCRAR